MGIRKNGFSKIVKKQVNDTYLDVRIIKNYVGIGNERKMKSSNYGIFHAKNKIKDGFNKVEGAVDFIVNNFVKYNKKEKKFNI